MGRARPCAPRAAGHRGARTLVWMSSVSAVAADQRDRLRNGRLDDT
jgi:hypothetical protein